jgi:N-methylhydantoinase A
MSRHALGVDVGGTFTDFVLIRGDQLLLHKRLSTPHDPSIGVLAGVQEVAAKYDIRVSDLGRIVHGTTVVANALIERKGARTGLLTTQGFRDVLQIGREVRYDIYDLGIRNPEPLAPRELRREIPERTLADGEIRTRPQARDVQAVAAELVAQGVESLGVCLMNSYRNADNERAVAAALKQSHPQLHVTLSSDVAPEIREFERTSTTVANAYVHPLVDRYMAKLQAGLRELGFDGELFIMLSHGGTAAVDSVRRFPIQLVESGPAAGAQASLYLGAKLGIPRLLAFDMGGTTAKATLIDGGEVAFTIDTEVARLQRFKKGSGLPLRVASVDMIEIGAGGGSIARIDGMGLLKVGPESAGANPGPACYGLGGTLPTVTDANLVLGYLNPSNFLGGEMALDAGRARAAIEQHVAKPLNIEVAAAAAGIVALANESMATAARVHAAERGKDASRFTMCAFGGAGPLHAFGVAQSLRLPRLLYPMGAGVLSALGFLVAPAAQRLVRSYVSLLATLDWPHLERLLGEMHDEGAELLAQAGVRPDEMTFEYTAEMRYAGQGHELPVALTPEVLERRDSQALREAFEKVYESLFAIRLHGVPVEALNWRLACRGPAAEAPLASWAAPRSGDANAAKTGERPIFIPASRSYSTVPVYDRYRLGAGVRLAGPAIIEERESTVVINGTADIEVDRFANLIVDTHRR